MVKVDASDIAVGEALLQHDEDGNLVVIKYCSKVLTAGQRAYSIGDKELFALYHAVTVEFRLYLWGTYFKAYTDHKPVLGTMQSADWIKLKKTKRRWIERLCGEYSFFIQHCPGSEMQIADKLSRLVDYTIEASVWKEGRGITSQVGDCTRPVEVVAECSCGILDAPYGVLGGEDVVWTREE